MNKSKTKSRTAKKCNCPRTCWCRKKHNKTKITRSSKTKKCKTRRLKKVKGGSALGGAHLSDAYNNANTFTGSPNNPAGGLPITSMKFTPLT
jgi:hypothetical protein